MEYLSSLQLHTFCLVYAKYYDANEEKALDNCSFLIYDNIF